jgi:hypothetical protein
VKKIELLSDGLAVRFSVSPQQFTQVKDSVKSLKGSRWVPDKKYWRVENSVYNINFLKNLGFDIPSKLVQEKPASVVQRGVKPQKDIDESKLTNLPYKLRDYQIQALKFLEANNWNGMISLGMRMGKTAVSLMGTKLHKELLPCLILTTSSGKAVWRDEIELWLHKDSIILQGETPHYLPHSEFYIINYAIVPFLADWLIERGFSYFIADEVHNASNSTQLVQKLISEYEEEVKVQEGTGKKVTRTKKVPVQCSAAFEKLAEHCNHVVELSGTPMTTCPKQLRLPLSVYHKPFKNEYWFLQKFCDPRHDGYGWRYEGISNEEILYPILDRWIFRRTKQQVFKDLPQEAHQFINIDVDQALYEKELAQLKKEIKKEHLTENEVNDKIASFESLSYTQKRATILEWVKDYIAGEGEKIALFFWHRNVGEDLQKVFKKQSVLIYGGTSEDDRDKFKKQFNSDPKIKVGIFQIKSCMEAITLSGSDTIAYVELPFTAGQLQQTAERIWIAGSEQEKLFYYYFIARGTIDKKRVEVLQARAKLLGRVLDREEGTVFGGSLLEELKE